MLSQEEPLLTKLNRSHMFDLCSYRRHIKRVTVWKRAQRGDCVSDRLRFPNPGDCQLFLHNFAWGIFAACVDGFVWYLAQEKLPIQMIIKHD